MKVSAVLKGTPDQLGRVPVTIRIANGRVRSFEQTKIRVLPAQWKNGKATGPDAATINARVRAAIIAKEVELQAGERKYPDAEFFSYFNKCMREWAKSKAFNTLRNYLSFATMLKEYRASFMLSDIDLEFLKGYAQHCKNKSGNTIWSNFKWLKAIVSKAVRERVIEHHPFDLFDKPKYRDPQREFLTKEQVGKIESWLPKAGSYQLCATWFVIGCYTGLRYGDMNAFNRQQHIKGGRLIIYTQKTGEPVSIAVSKKAAALLTSIQYQSLFISNQKYNVALKEIMKRCEIDIKVTAHTSRHTFATMAATMGISIEVVAKILGHTSTKPTQIYYKLVNTRIDREMEKMG